MRDIYCYIYRKTLKDGTPVYRIIKDQTDYGSFKVLEEALHERDMLMECGWNWDKLCEHEWTENKYYDMVLPDFYNGRTKYIVKCKNRSGSKVKYCIRKKIDGKLRRFGRYDSLDDAILMRDKLIAHDWCSIGELKLLEKG